MSKKYLVPVPAAKWKKVEVECISVPGFKLKIEEASRGRVKIMIYNGAGDYNMYMSRSDLPALAEAINIFSDQISEEDNWGTL